MPRMPSVPPEVVELVAWLCPALSLVGVAGYYWYRVDQAHWAEHRREFFVWLAKGLGVPVLFWFLLGTGVGPWLPSLWDDVFSAQASGWPWWPVLLGLLGPGVLFIASCWTALTLGWVVVRMVRCPGRRSAWVGKVIFWGIVLFPAMALLIGLAGWWTTAFAVTLPLVATAHSLAGKKSATLPPLYSHAVARMKRGKYKDAEWEIIRELERCEEDFDGWMLLAELYARHFGDLPAAEQTVLDLCAQPSTNASQVAVALHRLADWQLEVGENPAAARGALEEICRRMPGTHLARMARLRIERLPATREEWKARREGIAFRLPAVLDNAGDGALPACPPMNRDQALSAARQLRDALVLNPDDVDARERFACILAERLFDVDTALGQIELLLAIPGQPDRNRARWLGLMAAWHQRYRQDQSAARAIWERLVREFPQTLEGFTAQRRLALLAAGERLRRTRPQT